MSLSELFQDLDPKIAGPLQRITEALRAEISSQIDGVRRDVQSLAGGDATAAASGVRPAARDAGLDALEELKHAAAGIDRSTQQAAILTGLLEGAGRFSSRAAFVLIRDDGHRCWGSLGFDDARREMQGAAVEVPNGDSVWSRIREGAGTCGLTAAECAVFCSQFEASTPSMGALLPLSLGEHVAGYLYADRVGDQPLNLSALQLLTFVAGQTLETLPVRKRRSTPALTVAEAVAAPAPAAVLEPAAAEVEAEPVAVEEPEPAAAAVPEARPEEAWPQEALETMVVDVEPEAVEAAEPESVTDFYEVEAPEAETTERAAAAEAPTAEVRLPPTEEPIETAPVDVVPEEEPAAAEPVSAPPAAPAPPAEEPSTQVVPPDDVLGPGWAFTTKDGGGDVGHDALHEEARRLARLLVTEIKLYNEEQVEQGRRSGDIYRRLQEDIDRSRQIFEDRIDEKVRGDNDYFRDALVRILAAGDESLLGR